MKSILFIGVLVLVGPLISKAQTQKGQWTVGTQIGSLSYKNQDNEKQVSASFNPSAGYFVINGLVVGTGLPFNIGSTNADAVSLDLEDKSNGSSIGLAPFIRYFLGKKKLKPYMGLAYSFSRSILKITHNQPGNTYQIDQKGKATALIPTVGLAYFISQNLGLTAEVNYNIVHEEYEATSIAGGQPGTSNSQSDQKSLLLTIGFQILLNK